MLQASLCGNGQSYAASDSFTRRSFTRLPRKDAVWLLGKLPEVEF